MRKSLLSSEAQTSGEITASLSQDESLWIPPVLSQLERTPNTSGSIQAGIYREILRMRKLEHGHEEERQLATDLQNSKIF
jgi:hypothetical protein